MNDLIRADYIWMMQKGEKEGLKHRKQILKMMNFLQPDNTREGSVTTTGQLQQLLQSAGRLVKAPDGGAVLAEGEVDEVDQVVFPGWQGVQERVVVGPEGSSWVRSCYEVQIGPMSKHLRRLVYPWI